MHMFVEDFIEVQKVKADDRSDTARSASNTAVAVNPRRSPRPNRRSINSTSFRPAGSSAGGTRQYGVLAKRAKCPEIQAACAQRRSLVCDSGFQNRRRRLGIELLGEIDVQQLARRVRFHPTVPSQRVDTLRKSDRLFAALRRHRLSIAESRSRADEGNNDRVSYNARRKSAAIAIPRPGVLLRADLRAHQARQHRPEQAEQQNRPDPDIDNMRNVEARAMRWRNGSNNRIP